MLYYESLYRHLGDYNRAVGEKCYSLKRETYAKIAEDIKTNITRILREYPGENLISYNSVLKRYGINLDNSRIENVRVEALDIPGILTLIFAATRADRFSRSSFEELMANGTIIPWLQQLQKLDIVSSIEADSSKCFEFDTANIHIVAEDITKMQTDCIVNSANENYLMNGAVCVSIFNAAGKKELRKACDKLPPCKPGEAAYTEGFALPTKYIIHAVGPGYANGYGGEHRLLTETYYSAFERMEELGCRTITFPLISSGMKGFPRDEAWQVAIEACDSFLKNRKQKQEHIDIYFSVLDEEAKVEGQQYLEDYYNRNWKEMFRRYYGLMEMISTEKTLSDWCLGITPYHTPAESHSSITKWIDSFYNECLESEFGQMPETIYQSIVNGIGEDYYSKAVLEYPEVLKLMCPAQLRAAVCQYIRADRFTGNAMYIGAGNGAFSAILGEWVG